MLTKTSTKSNLGTYELTLFFDTDLVFCGFLVLIIVKLWYYIFLWLITVIVIPVYAVTRNRSSNTPNILLCNFSSIEHNTFKNTSKPVAR